MKIRLPSFCWQCFNETSQTKEDYDRLKTEFGDDDIEVEFNNENSYPIECKKGHISTTKLQNEKFELLFDIAAMALIDGYTKECVSTLASSLERFIEFYIKVIAVKKKVPIINYNSTWTKNLKLSERQLGAFYAIQLTEYGETKFVIDEKKISFRNKVTHQGYIPKTIEAIEYGEYVLSFIFSVLIDLKKNDLEAIQKARMINFTDTGVQIPEMQIKQSLSIPTIVHLSLIKGEGFGQKTFKEAVTSISKNNLYKHFYSKRM